MEMLGKERETAVLDTTIAWGEMGRGYPLVLLHGILDSHRTWRRAAPLLAPHFRVIMPDLIGHGYSGRPDASYTLSYHADVIAAWMQAIGVERAHICGHSLGGGIAQWLLLQHRVRVARLALVASGGLGREVAMMIRLAAVPTLGRLFTPTIMRLVIPNVLKFAAGRIGHMEPEEQARFIEMTRIPGTDRAFQRTVEAVCDFSGQRIQAIDLACDVADMPPTALFWCTNDKIIPIRHAWAAVTRSEGLTVAEYKGCGHYPHLDAAEQFARDLVEFLNDEQRPSARICPRETKR